MLSLDGLFTEGVHWGMIGDTRDHWYIRSSAITHITPLMDSAHKHTSVSQRLATHLLKASWGLQRNVSRKQSPAIASTASHAHGAGRNANRLAPTTRHYRAMTSV